MKTVDVLHYDVYSQLNGVHSTVHLYGAYAEHGLRRISHITDCRVNNPVLQRDHGQHIVDTGNSCDVHEGIGCPFEHLRRLG